MRSVQTRVVHVVFGIEHNGQDVNFSKPQVNAEIVVATREQFRSHDFRGVVIVVPVVAFDESEHLPQRSAGDEDTAPPVMDQCTRRRSRRFVPTLDPLKYDLAISQFPFCISPVSSRQTIKR